MLAAIVAVVGVTGGVWWWLLGVADQAAPGTDRAQARLSVARIALAAGGGAGAGVGLMLAFRRQQHQEMATVLIDRDAVERRISDRYTAAIDQLGSDKLDVRLGGIYALERIAADSERDHPTVVDVLCTFIRAHTRPGISDDSDRVLAAWMAEPVRPRYNASQPAVLGEDVQAAITVIGRRKTTYDTRNLDLYGVNLSGANMSGADLTRANLGAATLNGVNLVGASLIGANLTHATLNGAVLAQANLSDARLAHASLKGSILARASLVTARLGASLEGANLSGANLSGADLAHTDLTGAVLSGADLRGAHYNYSTTWPEGFTPPD